MIRKLPTVKVEPKKRDHVHHFHLEIPYDILNRMVEEGGVVRGTGQKFILEAIVEKLDRLKEE
jgi:hypothetical protein